MPRRDGGRHERRRGRAVPRVARTRNASSGSRTRAAARTAPRSRPTVRSSSPRTAASTSRCCPACSRRCRSACRAVPGLQLAAPDGTVTLPRATTASTARTISRSTPDGACIFTDPGHYPPRERRQRPRDGLRARRNGDARSPTASTTATASRSSPTARSWWSNGAACSACHPTATASGSIEKLGRGGGDGFCLDADGRFYVASTIEHGIRVVDPDGTIVDFLPDRGRRPHDQLLLRRRRPAHAVRHRRDPRQPRRVRGHARPRACRSRPGPAPRILAALRMRRWRRGRRPTAPGRRAASRARAGRSTRR